MTYGFTVLRPGDPLPVAGTSFLFLAGPVDRIPGHDGEVELGWRRDALNLLERRGYRGIVYLPVAQRNHEIGRAAAIAWERGALNRSDIVLFWVPRSPQLPGLLTNMEFGEWHQYGKCVLGFPPEASQMEYLEHVARERHVQVLTTIEDTIDAALRRLGDGARRELGECDIPLHVWRTEQCQSWLKSKGAAGHRIDGARLLWYWGVGPDRSVPFAFALHVDVHVNGEDRNKSNEVLVSRPDSFHVVAFERRGDKITDARVVLVREFRSPGATTDGFIHETPGGSTTDVLAAHAVAAAEFAEETGLVIAPDRLTPVGSRQASGTFSTHRLHAFSVELAAEEMRMLEADHVARGIATAGERTYPEVVRFGDLLAQSDVDWANVGMIAAALHEFQGKGAGRG